MQNTNNKFNQLNIPSQMLDTLLSLNYIEMTPIQAKSLPLILEGNDLMRPLNSVLFCFSARKMKIITGGIHSVF